MHPTQCTGLIVEDLGEEIVMYQQADGHAHCLTGFATTVWRACTGKVSMEQIVLTVQSTHQEVTEAEVYAIVADLAEKGLIVVPEHSALTRHEFLKKAVATVGLAALITSVSLSHASPAMAY